MKDFRESWTAYQSRESKLSSRINKTLKYTQILTNHSEAMPGRILVGTRMPSKKMNLKMKNKFLLITKTLFIYPQLVKDISHISPELPLSSCPIKGLSGITTNKPTGSLNSLQRLHLRRRKDRIQLKWLMPSKVN